jgi:hypothetical protein
MLCQLCGKQKKLVEAHIIPRSWYENLRNSGGGPMLQLHKNPDVYPKASQTGEYDREILCGECDNIFSPWENYTRTLLFKDLDQKIIQTGPTGQRWYVIPEYNYMDMKLCLLSILWRMSISKRPSFAEVRLGPFESQIKDIILHRDPGGSTVFTTFVYRYEDYVGSSTMMGTHRERIHGINVYNLGLPGFVAVIKVDRQPVPIPLSQLVLSPNSALVIGLRHMDKGNEWGFVTKIFENHWRRQNERIL